MKTQIAFETNYICTSLAESKIFSHKLAKSLTPPYVLYLNGDLGVGKTFVSHSIGSFFESESVKSSSFSRVSFSRGRVNIIHCDFYRTPAEDYFFEYEVEPLLIDPWIILIEWGEVGSWNFGCPEYELRARHLGHTERQFSLFKY